MLGSVRNVTAVLFALVAALAPLAACGSRHSGSESASLYPLSVEVRATGVAAFGRRTTYFVTIHNNGGAVEPATSLRV